MGNFSNKQEIEAWKHFRSRNLDIEQLITVLNSYSLHTQIILDIPVHFVIPLSGTRIPDFRRRNLR